jgi:hypothetical protein
MALSYLYYLKGNWKKKVVVKRSPAQAEDAQQ